MGYFVSPIDGKTYSTEWTGGAKTVMTPVENWGSGESSGSNIQWNGWTGALTNTPGEALTYQYHPGQNPAQFRAGDETNRGNEGASVVEMAAPEYQQWLSHYWAYKHPEEYAATQAEQRGGGGLFDMAKGLASSNTMLPVFAALGAGFATALSGTAVATEAATLAAGDAMAGIGATEAAAAATAASETAAMSAWAGLPAETGGSIVGSNGLIGSTGNAIGDAVLNNSIQSGLTSAVSGGDPLEGALRGAAGGLISSSGVLNDVSAALTPSDAGQVATNAISRGINAAGTAAVTGGDPVTAGLTSGIGNYVGGTVAETGAPPVVAGAAGGGAAGATGAALNGGDIANGLITGAAGGGASGLASQLGANSGVASGIGSIVGGVVGSELADDQTAAGPTPVGTPAPTPTPFVGMTFADMLPPEFVDVTRTTDWGSNRLATAGRI